jgi:sporulation protein YlmC with PRC-barrel domain
MRKKLLVATLLVAGAWSALVAADAQVAGSTTLGVSVAELTQVALGWSVKKSILDKTVYNDAGEKVGNVEDLIISPDRRVSYLIIGAGGFLGIGRHDVAIPATQIQDTGTKLVMHGATKAAIKSMPQFDYADDASNREQFVANAEQDIGRAKLKVGELDKKAAVATSDAKVKLDLQVVALRKDLKVADEKVGEMKRATAKRWKEFEAGVNAATARLRSEI